MARAGLIQELRRFAADRRGNIAVITAIVILPLMVAAGGVVDYGEAQRQRSHLQQAADIAALAAAPHPQNDWQEIAHRAFFSNYSHGGDVKQLRVAAAESGGVTVSADADIRTSFLPLIGMETLRLGVAATAIAGRTPDETVTETVEVTVEARRTVCMLSLANSGGNALLVNSPAKVQADDCDVHVRSSGMDAFMFNSNSRFDANEFCIAGTATVRGTTTGEIKTRCAAANDTLAGAMPQPPVGSCTFNHFTPQVSSQITLQPGTYCGWSNFNGSPKITLQPGLYVIKDGGWNLNDGTVVEGQGVTIYFADNNSTINMNGKMSWNIAAPKQGPYAGILYFEKPGPATNRQAIFNGENGQRLEGLIYLPTRQIVFNSKNFPGTVDEINVVANTIIINGQADWRLRPYEGHKIPGSTTTTTVTEERETVIPGEIGSAYLVN